MRWRDARGVWSRSLQVRCSPGRPLKLDQAQRNAGWFLLQGPLAHGYRTNLWTTARIAELVEREFKVQYHSDHIGRLMHAWDESAENRSGAP